jgi:16S rRNA (guanine1207-N2)-methyltransferase
VVTITGLRRFIERNFEEVFGNYKKLKQGKDYTVARACKE